MSELGVVEAKKLPTDPLSFSVNTHCSFIPAPALANRLQPTEVLVHEENYTAR